MSESAGNSTLSARDFHDNFKLQIDDPVSIFQTVNDDDDDDSAILDRRNDESLIKIQTADEQVKVPPKSEESLVRSFRDRLRLSSDIETVSEKDQIALADTLTKSIVAAWPEHRKQSADPFLSPQGNKELARRVAVYVIETCEDLFYQSVQKLEETNRRKVFSCEANVSRICTQLSSQAAKKMHILDVRRHIAEIMRKLPDEAWFKVEEKGSSMGSIDQAPTYTITKQDAKTRNIMLQKEVAEMQKKMPILPDYDRNILFVPNSRQQTPMREKRVVSATPIKIQQRVGVDAVPSGEEDTSQLAYDWMPVEKANSVRMLNTDIDAFEEFEGVQKAKGFETGSIRNGVGNTITKDVDVHERALSPRADLQMLLNKTVKEKAKMDKEEATGMTEDLHPLLQAAPLVKKNRSELERKIQQLEMQKNAIVDMEGIDSESIAETVSTIDARKEKLIIEDIVEDPPIQPSTVSMKVPGKGIVRASDVRISNRINESVITLEKYPTVYNEFMGEISDEMVTKMDQKLFIGDQIQEVYDEILKTMNKDYLRYDQDPMVRTPAATLKDNEDYFVSHLIQRRTGNMRNAFNKNLGKIEAPPWGADNLGGMDEWRNEPRFNGMGREDMIRVDRKNIKDSMGELDRRMTANSGSTRAINQDNAIKKNINHLLTFSAWLQWYQGIVNVPDYQKFLTNLHNDYLGQIFHLYDSPDEEDEDDDEKKALRETANKLKMEKLKRRNEVRKMKSEYSEGFWNAQSVMLGGLGLDPEDLKEEQRLLPPSRLQSRMTDNQSISTTRSGKQEQIKTSPYLLLQERLDNIWKHLKMPDNLKLNMALKYSSSDESFENFSRVIERWEEATELIVEREKFIGKLESFEVTASDPNRFFERGNKGSSLARINESKIRENLTKTIKKIEEKLAPMLSKLKKKNGDILTYQGRPYEQKMASDRVEMLYWLQQERRKVTIGPKPPTSQNLDDQVIEHDAKRSSASSKRTVQLNMTEFDLPETIRE